MPHIWTYWHTEVDPSSEIAVRYLNSWSRYCDSEWDIHVLNDRTVHQYVHEEIMQYKTCGLAAFSDVLRLYLLSTYGGLWMDASIVLHKPITEVIRDQSRITVFQLWSNKYVESWFLYTPASKREVFRQWYIELCSVMKAWPNVVDHRVYREIPVQVSIPQYFMVYQSWLYLCSVDARFKQAFAKKEAIVTPVQWEMFPLGNKMFGACLLKTTHKTRWFYKNQRWITTCVAIAICLALVFLAHKQNLKNTHITIY